MIVLDRTPLIGYLLFTMFRIENIILKNSSEVELVSESGDILKLELEGDCCSGSYFDDNSVLDVKSLLGETLMSVEDSAWECPDKVDGECRCDGDDESTQHSALIVKTDRQSITMMWRNVSNGYYSGWLNMYLNGERISRFSEGKAEE